MNYTYTAVTTELLGGSWMRESTRIAHELRTAGLCGLCGKKVRKGDGQIAHMIPRCQGGMNGPDNTLFVCSTCNYRMGAMTLAQYCATKPRASAAIYARAMGYLSQPLPREEARKLAASRKVQRVRALSRLGRHTAKSVSKMMFS